MRVAVFHDYLNQFGGAERVLKSILSLFPSADLYTLLYDEKKTLGIFSNYNIKTSFLDFDLVRNKHRGFIPLMPFASSLLKIKEDYDLIISSSAGYAKGFGSFYKSKNKNAFHICYCHSPLRYAWEMDYLKNLSFSPKPMSKDVLWPIAKWLRNWDKNASKNVNIFIANSNFISSKINSYYERDSDVIYPPVSKEKFYYEPNTKEEDFYLMVGRLIYYKGFDLGIKAFNNLKKPLKIIGQGPEEKKLKSIADPYYIEFINYVDDDKLRHYYNSAKALIFPQIEDFGLVAAEAQICGLPILAFSKGGGGEIAINGETGIVFNEQTTDSIMKSVKDFEFKKFNRKKISSFSLDRFSEEEFKSRFIEIIHKAGFRI